MIVHNLKSDIKVKLSVPNKLNNQEIDFDVESFEKLKGYEVEVLESEKNLINKPKENIVYNNFLEKELEDKTLIVGGGVQSNIVGSPSITKIYTSFVRFNIEGSDSNNIGNKLNSIKFYLEKIPHTDIEIIVVYGSGDVAGNIEDFTFNEKIYSELISRGDLLERWNEFIIPNGGLEINKENQFWVGITASIVDGGNFYLGLDDGETYQFGVGDLIEIGGALNIFSLLSTSEYDRGRNFLIQPVFKNITKKDYDVNLSFFTDKKIFNYYLRYKTIFSNGETGSKFLLGDSEYQLLNPYIEDEVSINPNNFKIVSDNGNMYYGGNGEVITLKILQVNEESKIYYEGNDYYLSPNSGGNLTYTYQLSNSNYESAFGDKGLLVVGLYQVIADDEDKLIDSFNITKFGKITSDVKDKLAVDPEFVIATKGDKGDTGAKGNTGLAGKNSVQYKLFTVGGEVLKTGSTIVKVMKIDGDSRTVLQNNHADNVIMKDNDGTKIDKNGTSSHYQYEVNYDSSINGYAIVLIEGSIEIDSIKIAMIEDGINGIPSYVHIKFSDNSNGNPFDNVNTREYMGIATTNSETAPVAYGAYIWTKHKGLDGNDSIYAVLTSETDNYKKEAETENYPATTIELYKGGVKLTNDVKYFDTGAVVGGTFDFSNDNATATFNGFDDGSESASIVLTAEYDNNNYSKTYTVTKVSDGLSGIPSYTYFGYADDDTGAEFSTSPIGKTYMATLVTNVKITRELIVDDFSECIWFKFKGETGDDAVLYKIVSDNGNIFKYDSSDSSYEPSTINLSIKEFSGGLGQTYNGTDLSIYKEDSENPLNLVDGIEPNDIVGEKNTYILKGTKSSQEIIDSFTIVKLFDGLPGEDAVEYKLFTVGGEVLKTGSTIVKVMKIDGDSRTVLQNNHADNVIMKDNDGTTINKDGTSSHYQYEVNYSSEMDDCLITLFEVFDTEHIEIDSIKIAMIKDGEMGESPTIYKIASDKGFIVRKDVDDNIPFRESIIWLSKERDGENIFNLLNQNANYLKLSITKIKGSSVTYNYTGNDVKFYKDNIEISFDDFDEDGEGGNYYLLSKFNIDGDLLITIKDVPGNILDSQNVYEIFNGSDSIDAVLLNDLHTVACESDGTPTNEDWANNAKTGIKVFKGGREVTDFTVLKNEVLSEPSGNTFTFDDVNKIFKCTSLNADSVVYDIPIYYGNITMNKKFKVIKQKKGATGEDGEDATLYRLITTNGNVLKEDGTTTIKIVKNSGKYKQIITNLSDLDLALYVDDGSGGYTLLKDEEVREYEKQVNYNDAINGFNVYLASYIGELNHVVVNLYDSIKIVSLVDLIQYKIVSDLGNIFKYDGSGYFPDAITLSIRKFSNGISETYNGSNYKIYKEDNVNSNSLINLAINSSDFTDVSKITYKLREYNGSTSGDIVDTFTIIKMSEPATNYKLITTNGTTLKYGEETTVKIVKEVGNGREIVVSGDIKLYWSGSSGSNYEEQVDYSDAINGFTITLEDRTGTTNILYDSIKIVSLVDLIQYKIVSDSGNVFKYNGSGYYPNAITLSIRKFSNGFSEAYSGNDLKIYKEDAFDLSHLTPPITINGSEFDDYNKITYKLREYDNSTSESGDIVDTFTITKLSDGVDGESIEISYFVDTYTEMEDLITTSPYLTTSNIGEICYVSDDQMIYFLESNGLGGVKWGGGLKFGKGKDAINVILSNDTISIPYYSTGEIKDNGDKYITVSAFQGITSVPLGDYEILSNSILGVGGTFERDSSNNKKLNFTGFNAGENVAICSFDVRLTIGEADPEFVPKTLRVFKQIDGIDGINSIQYKLFTVGGEVLKTGSTTVKVMKIDGASRSILKNNDTTDYVFMFNNSNAVIDKDSSSDDYSTIVTFSGSEVEKIIYLRNGRDSVTDDIIDSIKINKIVDGINGINSIQYKLFTVGGEVLKTGSTIVRVMKIDGDSRSVLGIDQTEVAFKDITNDIEAGVTYYQTTVSYDSSGNDYTVVLKEGSTEIDSIKIAMIKDGDSNYIHIAYCNDPSYTFSGNNAITQNPNEHSKFMATVVNENINWNSSYFSSLSNWTKFVGEDSIYAVLTSETDNYKTGASSSTIELYKGGIKLTNGVTYSQENSVGGNFTSSNDNATATFTGFGVGSESASIVLTAEYDNNNYSKTYTVTKVSDGLSGIPSYTYFGYADDNIGTGFSISPIGKTHMATLVTNVEITRELTVDDFSGCTWFKFKGEDGDNATLYKLFTTNGDVLKDTTSSTTVKIHNITGSSRTEVAGGNVKLYHNDDALDYQTTINYATASDGYLIELRDTDGTTVIDSIKIISISDGSDGDNAINYTLSSVGGGVFKSGDGGTSYEPTTIELIINKIDGSSRTKILKTNTDFKIRKFGETAYLGDFIIEPGDIVGNQVYELVDVSDVSNVIVLDSFSIVKVTDGIKIESILTGANTILYIPMTSGVVGINQDLSTFSDVEAWNNLGIEGGLVSDSYAIFGGKQRYLKITKGLRQSINGKISFSFLYKPTEIINGSAPESSLFSLYGVESDGEIDKKIAIIFTSRHYVAGTDNKIEIKYYYYENGETSFTSSGIVSSDFEQRTETSDFNHFVIGVDNYNSNSFDFNMSINNSKETINIELGSNMELKSFDFLTLGLYDNHDNHDNYFDEKYNSLLFDSDSLPNDVSYYYDEFRILSTSLSGDNISLIYDNNGKIDNMLSAYLTNSVPDLLPSLNKTKYIDDSSYNSSNLNIGQILFDGTSLKIMTSKGLKTITIS